LPPHINAVCFEYEFVTVISIGYPFRFLRRRQWIPGISHSEGLAAARGAVKIWNIFASSIRVSAGKFKIVLTF
jgi:hypothetical protein